MRKDKLTTKDGNMFTVFYLGEKKSQIISEAQAHVAFSVCPVGFKGKAGVKGVSNTDEQKALMIWKKATRPEGDEGQYLN